jgi:hypothetical protein
MKLSGVGELSRTSQRQSSYAASVLSAPDAAFGELSAANILRSIHSALY